MKKSNTYETILVITVGFVIIYLLSEVTAFMVVALSVGILSILSRFLAEKISWLWMKLGEGIGWFMSKIILSIVFYLFLFPISLIYRIFNKDKLNIKRKERSTLYVERNHTYGSDEMNNVW